MIYYITDGFNAIDLKVTDVSNSMIMMLSRSINNLKCL